MTAVAFIGGVYPLVVASGAGAEMRQSLGTAVFSGMIGVALFGIFLTPVFFFILLRLGGEDQSPGHRSPPDGSTQMASRTQSQTPLMPQCRCCLALAPHSLPR